MHIFQGHTRIASAEDLKWIPERQRFHYEPDFCGRMNVVLDEPIPARVSFKCHIQLTVGHVYTFSDGAKLEHRVRISRANDNCYTATVVDP